MKKFFPTIAALILSVSPASAHSIYEGLVNSRGQMCCGGTDCGPVSPEAGTFKRDADGNMWVRRSPNDDWYEVDIQNILPTPSPDSHIHACIWGGEARCLMMPNGN